MKNTNVFTSEDVSKILNEEFMKFEKKWHGAMKGSDLQTLAVFVEQVKETVNEIKTTKC